MAARDIAQHKLIDLDQIEQAVNQQVCSQINEIAPIRFKQNGARHAGVSGEVTSAMKDLCRVFGIGGEVLTATVLARP